MRGRKGKMQRMENEKKVAWFGWMLVVVGFGRAVVL